MTTTITLEDNYVLTPEEPTITGFLELIIKCINTNHKYANAFITIGSNINQDNSPITSFEQLDAANVIIYATKINTAGIINGTFNTRHTLKDVLRDLVITVSVLSGYSNDDWTSMLSHIYYAYIRVYFHNGSKEFNESNFKILMENQWLIGIFFLEIVFMYQPSLYNSFIKNNETI